MAGTVVFGGATSTGTYTDRWIQSTGVSMATGRIAANGQGPIIITAIRPFTSGRGAGRTITVSLGAASTGAFGIAAGANGNVDQGWRSAANGLVANGGTRTYRIDTSGSTWFSRDNVGSGLTTDSYGTGFTGTLQGQYTYVESPNAPTGVTAVNSAGTVNVGWTAPSDNGGSAITGYVIQWATNVGFTTGVGSIAVGNVTSYGVTGLTNGVTYYFRVYAKNAVTDAAATTSVVSATSSAVLVGYWTYSGIASYRVLITNAGTYPNSVSFYIEHTIDVTDLVTDAIISGSIQTYFIPTNATPHATPLKITPSFIWKNSIGVTLSTVTLSSVETFSGSNVHIFSGMTKPSGAVEGIFHIEVPAANNYASSNLFLNDQFYADAALLTNGVIVSYFDGNGGGTYAWSGTTNLSRSYDTSTATPIYDAYADDNAVYQVRAGEVTVVTIETDTFPISVTQPTVSEVYPALPGTYVVSASDNLIVDSQQWTDYGGSARIEIGEEPGTFILTLTGPFEEIPGVPGPYSLLVTDDQNNYATFSVLGNGVITNPVTQRFSTGAAPERTTNEVALSFDSPFVSTLQEAVDAAAKLMIDAAGPLVSISLSVGPDSLIEFGATVGRLTIMKNSIYRYESLSVNRQSGQLIGRPYVGTDKIEETWSGLTAADFDNYWSVKTAGDFMIEPLRKP